MQMGDGMTDQRVKDENAEMHRVRGQIELQKDAQQLGKIGLWLGNRENAAPYIAAFFVLVCLLVLVGFAAIEPQARERVLEVFAAVVIAGVGFIAGSGRGGR